jgi:hypothetical protein
MGLAVGGPAEIWPVVDAGLHPYLRERLAGHVEVETLVSAGTTIRREGRARRPGGRPEGLSRHPFADRE